MSILIVRHGETDSNARRIIQTPDIPLSVKGNDQAESLAQRLKALGVTRIISSDYLRTRQTAEHVASATNLQVEFNPLLRERNFGDLRGTSYDDLVQNPFDVETDYIPPSGESWLVFNLRVAQAWKQISEIASTTQGRLLVVTHGLVCRSLYQRQFNIPSALKDLSNYGNTALSEVDEIQPWTMRLLNCTAHLQADSASDNSAVA
ncbi:MAG: putative phosphoglycerate mutase [Arenicella sp.]|jgi:probable phosphoglycerate mutase